MIERKRHLLMPSSTVTTKLIDDDIIPRCAQCGGCVEHSNLDLNCLVQKLPIVITSPELPGLDFCSKHCLMHYARDGG